AAAADVDVQACAHAAVSRCDSGNGLAGSMAGSGLQRRATRGRAATRGTRKSGNPSRQCQMRGPGALDRPRRALRRWLHRHRTAGPINAAAPLAVWPHHKGARTVTNQQLLQRRAAAVLRGVATAMPNFADRAGNSEIWDADGRRLVDFAGGIAVLNVGHRHPKVAAAVQAQLERYTHTAFQVMAYEPYVALAERLNAIAPVEGPAKTIL